MNSVDRTWRSQILANLESVFSLGRAMKQECERTYSPVLSIGLALLRCMPRVRKLVGLICEQTLMPSFRDLWEAVSAVRNSNSPSG